MPIADFPIHSQLAGILASLAAHPRLVLEAPPGAGKTTQVPPALLDATWLAGRRIVMLEPRRLAARMAAEFMARSLGEPVGQTVGYRVRFESRISAATRIEVLTEGILTRLIQTDPELTEIGILIFDEFHERHLQADLGAALALEIQHNLRPDLRLLVMSATLDGARVAQWLDAPRITSPGRSYPLQIRYQAPPAQGSLGLQVRRVLAAALADSPGDVLVFLPGRREIAEVGKALASLQDPAGAVIEILPLHGDLGLQAQHAALSPASSGIRRVVLATNLAESSVTLPGIRLVIDSGLAREPRFDPGSGFSRLVSVPISQASADQRAGRAGRTAPGYCWRLWPQSRRLQATRTAEITQVDLSTLALELAAWGSASLPWLDPPPAGAMAQARDWLQRLGATDASQRITPLGRRMLKLGTSPRLAAMVLRASAAEHGLVADLLSLLEARSPLRGVRARNDDFRVRLMALQAWRNGGVPAARQHGADAGALVLLDRSSRGWQRRLGGSAPAVGLTGPLRVGNHLLHAFPDRVARQDPGDPLRYRLANGRGAILADDSELIGEPWLVVVELRFGKGDNRVLSAAPFHPDRLDADYPQCFHDERELRWNTARGVLEAYAVRRFERLRVAVQSVPLEPAEAVPMLLTKVREQGLAVLPWNPASVRLRQRTRALAGWCPELDLPDLADPGLLASIDTWLAPLLTGLRGPSQVSPEALQQALLGRFSYAQRQTLEREAPQALRVPSGRKPALTYVSGEPPVLAVKLQELFGLGDTPRIARGRIPVLLHLLSPAGRPLQVTNDLHSFWTRTYPEIRKALQGRYPRHPWPADPWNAVPTHRVKPRSG